MVKLLEGFGFEVVPVTDGSASRVARAYERWGRARDRAGLNLSDCFAYEVAAAASRTR
jgi:ribonuclease VapC